MIKIKYDMKQVIGVLFGSFILIAFCLLFLLFDIRDISDDSPFNNPVIYYLCKGVILFCAFFFIFSFVFVTKNVIKYKDNVIEIYDDYMIDRSTYIALGKIEYKDIEYLYREWKGMERNTEEYRTFIQQFVKEIKVYPYNFSIVLDIGFGVTSELTETIVMRRGELYKLFDSRVRE